MPPSLCILVWVYLGLVHPSRAINLSSIDLGLPVTHIASNPTSDIFVGGVNFLAHLSADLSINMNVSIGPVEEAEFCWPDPAPCDNHVKILAIDSTLNQLLVCGSAYQGTCTAHSLYDIGQWTCVRPPAAQRNADVLAYNPRNNFLLEFLPPVTEFREFAATGSSEGLGAAGVTGSSGLGVDVTGEGEGEDGAGECRSSLSFIPGDGYYYDDLPPETSQEPDTGQEPDSGQQMDRAKLGENREKAAWLAPAPAPAQNGREPGSGPGSESESESEFTQQGNGELVIFSRFFVAGNPHRSSPDEMVPWTFAQKRLTFDWRTSQFEMSSARGRLDGAPIGFDMSSRVRSEGYVNYIHSFQWGNHSYFLFHQETVCGEGSRQHACVRTMLSRVCNQEDSMLPYVELPLTCKNGTSSTYSLLTSAALGTVLQQKQTSKVHIPVLVTAFGNGTEPRSTVADPSYGSVVCVFPLDKLVSSEFSLAEQFCDSGPGLIKGADWIEGVETNCQKIESESESAQHCNPGAKNSYISGFPVEGGLNAAFLPGTAVSNIQTHTESEGNPERLNVYLITSRGLVKKFSFGLISLNQYSLDTISSITELVDRATLVESGLGQGRGQGQGHVAAYTNHEKALLYATFATKVVVVSLVYCQQFQTCQACREQTAGRCLWCNADSFCMDRDVALSECDLTQSGKCPPRLTSFSPIFAPVAGGTRLNLVGHNMGSAGEGTVNVTVCNQTCSDVAPNVNSLHCTLPAKCATCSDGCPVTVIAIAKQGTVDVRSTIPQRLHYQSPNVTSFNPICGPVSGGTTLVISGQHLTIGSQAVVTVAGRECTLLSRQGEDLKCIIGPSANKTISCGKVNVTIDWHQVPQSNKTFCFTTDPVVESLTPNGTIESGGIEIVVRGQGFQHVGYAELALVLSVYNKDSNKTLQFPFRSRCDLTGSDNEFRCTTPNLRNVTQVHYGRMFRDTAAGVRLVMDGFDGLAKSPRLSSMAVYRDPDLLTTSTELHISGRKPFLTIRGEHIPQSLGLNQFSVTVGNTTCEVTSVTHDKIVCDAYDVLVKYQADQENKHGGGYEIDGQSGKNWTSSENTTLSGNTTATATTTNTTTVTAAATTTLSPNASSEAVVVSSGPWPTTTTSRVSFDNNSSTPEVGRTLGDFLTLRGRAVGSGSSTPWPHWYAIRARRAERRRRRRRNREPQLYTLVVKIGNYEKEGKVQVGPRWNQTEVPLDSSPFLTQPTIIALGAGGGILLLMIVLVAVCCRVHAKAKKERKLAETFSNLGSSKGSAEGAVPSLKQILESVVEPGRRADLDRLIIDLDRLTVGNSIGSGNFGCVYEGMLNVSPDTPAVRVAVKTLQDPSYRVMDLKGFVQEAVLMKDFRHPHVLGLIGLAEKAPGIPYVVLPYMENGDLLTYIRDPSVILSLHDVIKFGADIASGMDYLSGLKFVHRDLAARNCMLGSDERVKVADFGLCRDIYEKGYYSSDNKKKLPIRWMAVESIEHGAYSTKSDVWSLGVVLWELLTRGVTPYPGVDGWDVINFLRRRRLAPPHFCPDRMYRLMLNCWAKNPTSRPTFKNIRMELLTMIGEDPFSTAPATPEPSAPSTPDPSRCGLDLQPPKSPARGGAAGSFDKAAQKPDSSSGGKTTSPTTGGKKPVPLPRGIPPKSKSSQDSGAAATAAKLRHPTSEDNNNGVGGGGVMTAGVVGGGSERSAARAKTHSDIMSVPKPSVVENVAITIPACYNHREVSKSAAADYLTLVDNYEAPPKFSNPLLRSKNRHGRKSNRSRKEKSSGSGKGRGAAATRNSGYLEVHGMQPSSVVGALASQSFEMTVLSTDPSGHTRSLLVDQRNKDNTYYDLETFDMDDTDGEYQSDRSSNVTSSHHDSSVASMLDSRYSAGSFVDSRYSSSAVGSHHASDSSLGSTPHAGGERLRVSSLHVPQRRTSPRQDVPGRGSTNVLDISEESSQHNSYEATSL